MSKNVMKEGILQPVVLPVSIGNAITASLVGKFSSYLWGHPEIQRH